MKYYDVKISVNPDYEVIHLLAHNKWEAIDNAVDFIDMRLDEALKYEVLSEEEVKRA